MHKNLYTCIQVWKFLQELFFFVFYCMIRKNEFVAPKKDRNATFLFLYCIKMEMYSDEWNFLGLWNKRKKAKLHCGTLAFDNRMSFKRVCWWILLQKSKWHIVVFNQTTNQFLAEFQQRAMHVSENMWVKPVQKQQQKERKEKQQWILISWH